MEWKTVLKVKADNAPTRRERSADALPTTIKHRDYDREIKERKTGQNYKPRYKDVPLTEENYKLAPRNHQRSYHVQMKMYYLVRGEPGDGAKAHFHREIENKMKIAGGPNLDMKGNEI